NSPGTRCSPVGPGWSWNLGAALDVSATSISIGARLEDGTRIDFTALGDGTYYGPVGGHSELVPLGSRVTSYELRRRDGTKLVFDTSGRLISDLDRNAFGVELTYS